MTALLYTVFFASGASALIFETLWFRQAGLAFGNSVWASSLVLSGFMGGLALGNAAAARYGDRLRNPVRTYAIAEIAIAVTGIGLVYLFPILGSALAPWLRGLLDQPWALNPLRLVIAFLLLLIPSTAMGITLPLLSAALTRHDADAAGIRDSGPSGARIPNPESRIPRSFGRVLGRLYGWNTLGAMFGVVIGETYLIGAYGVRGTALIAGMLNIFAAAVAAWLSIAGSDSRDDSTHISMSGADPSGPRRRVRESSHHPTLTPGTRWLAAAFLSGFCLLALEVVWFRLLLLFVKGHSSTFPVMLGIVLAGISLGGLVASSWFRADTTASGLRAMASPVAFSAGLLCVISYAVFPRFIAPLALATITRPLEILQIGVPLMFPVSFVSGILFTLFGAALRSHLTSESQTAGVLTLANTTGAGLGSLTAGFVLLPVLGMEQSLFLIAVIYGAVGTLLTIGGSHRTRPTGPAAPRRSLYASAAMFLVGLALFPFGSMEERLLPIPVARWADREADRRVIAVREGLTETVIYFERQVTGKPVSHVMLTNSFSMSTTGYGVRRYQKLYVYWPVAVHPDLRRALLIGYGVGNTAKAMTDSSSLETIDVVDLSRDILAMNRLVYPNEADLPLHDPRVRVHIEDGRYFLQTTAQRFDLITGEPPPPGIAGVENLYTREYFQLLRDRLADGGIATYWLPLSDLSDVSARAILRAFCDVFDDCSLWNGSGTNLMMIGTRGARGPVSEEQFTRQWNTPSVVDEMRRLGIEQPEQLGALFIGDADYLRRLTAGSGSLTDDDPKLIEASFSSREAGSRLLGSVTDIAAARQRFQDSPLIKRLWPQRRLAASLPYFEFQDVINAHMYGDLVKAPPGIEDVHRVVTRSSLSTPVVWRLASNSDIQRLVSDATPQELANPLLQFHLGIRLIAERHYAAAAEGLSRAEQLPDVSDNAFALHIYALCMSGETRQAEDLIREPFAQFLRASGVSADPKQASLPPFWLWMKNTFGIDPRN
jgi:spermidine synthase